MDASFPEDSEEVEKCPWCGVEIETGWGNSDDDDDEPDLSDVEDEEWEEDET